MDALQKGLAAQTTAINGLAKEVQDANINQLTAENNKLQKETTRLQRDIDALNNRAVTSKDLGQLEQRFNGILSEAQAQTQEINKEADTGYRGQLKQNPKILEEMKEAATGSEQYTQVAQNEPITGLKITTINPRSFIVGDPKKRAQEIQQTERSRVQSDQQEGIYELTIKQTGPRQSVVDEE